MTACQQALAGALSPLMAVADPNFVSGSGFSGGTASISSSNSTASATGGIPGYTYLWQFVSGDSGVLPNSSGSASTGFSKTMANNTTADAVYRCRVTDTASNQAFTNNVSINLINGAA